jgi:hypothetical protein
LLIESGDLEGYRRHCARILERFGETQDGLVAERMTKDCMIFPSSGIDLEAVVRMSGRRVYLSDIYPEFTTWLAECRQGHYERANEWMERVLQMERVLSSSGTDPNLFLFAQAHMVIAIAQHGLHNPIEARAAFARGMEIIETKLPKLESGDISEYWYDWIVAHALMREARALIGGAGFPD